MIIGIAYAFTILPKIITPEGIVKPSTTLLTTPTQPTFMDLVTALIMTAAMSVFYVWLAPAILDDKGVGSCLDMAVKAIRKSGRVFLGFIILFFMVSAIATLIRDFPAMIGATFQPLVGSLTPTSIVSQIIERVFSPLWFLIAFTIHRELSLRASEHAAKGTRVSYGFHSQNVTGWQTVSAQTLSSSAFSRPLDSSQALRGREPSASKPSFRTVTLPPCHSDGQSTRRVQTHWMRTFLGVSSSPFAS